MKVLLQTLLAAFALPTAVNTETILLLVGYAGGGLEKVEMIDMDTCKIEAKEIKKSGTICSKNSYDLLH